MTTWAHHHLLSLFDCFRVHPKVEELEDRTVPAANPLMQWFDLGIVYVAPSTDAYYPSVRYDAAGFDIGAPYRMWYSNGTTGYVTNSSDGINWNTPSVMTGLSSGANHIQVVYDLNQFGSGGYAYKAWFWDATGPYPGIHINYAESTDGVSWTVAQAITENPLQPLVTGVSADWNTGSYGPIDIHYQPVASNTGSNPWDYRYVMYYNGTNGNNEYTGLAYSIDGLDWSAYPTGIPGNPVLQGQPASWDSVSTAYGTVIQQSPTSYVYFYSGGDGTSPYGSAVSQGIGLASSTDGLTWAKDPDNPIFDISQGVPYRNRRVYTPEVILGGDGILRMYYSAVGNSGVKDIGLALNPVNPNVVYVDDDYTPINAGGHIFGYNAFTSIQQAENQVAAGGTIYVYAGTYSGSLIIDKSVTLTSTSGAAGTIIKGGDPYIITIQASDVSLTGFTITNPDYTGGGDAAGVLVQRPNPSTPVSNIDILDNIITDVRSQSGGPSAFGVTGINIGFGGPTDVTIAGNVIKNILNPDGGAGGDNTAGVNVWDNGTDITIRDNVFSNIKFNGVLFQYATDVEVADNTFDNLPVAVNAEPYDISVGVTNLTVTGNVATDAGIRLLGTTNAVIAGNTSVGAGDNAVSILGGSHNILIELNTLMQAGNYGVFVGDSRGFGPNTDVAMHCNRIVDNTLGGLLVEAAGYVGTVDARNNWWGTNTPDGTIIVGPADYGPWLMLHLIATPPVIVPGGTNILTATLNINSEGQDVSPTCHLPDGTLVSFATTWGSVNPTSTATTNGTAQSLLIGGLTPGPATISTTVDHQTVSITIQTTASLSGYVYLDLNNNGKKDPGDKGIARVKMTLYKKVGARWVQKAVAYTNASGLYTFNNVLPGTYRIVEGPTPTFRSGINSVGTVNGKKNGQVVGDSITNIVLRGGDRGINYNFCQRPSKKLFMVH